MIYLKRQTAPTHVEAFQFSLFFIPSVPSETSNRVSARPGQLLYFETARTSPVSAILSHRAIFSSSTDSTSGRIFTTAFDDRASSYTALTVACAAGWVPRAAMDFGPAQKKKGAKDNAKQRREQDEQKRKRNKGTPDHARMFRGMFHFHRCGNRTMSRSQTTYSFGRSPISFSHALNLVLVLAPA